MNFFCEFCVVWIMYGSLLCLVNYDILIFILILEIFLILNEIIVVWIINKIYKNFDIYLIE